ncbi:type VI secretion system protein TssA [Acidiphilium sp. AL]|uniref:Type VI secretion system protein TssA n=1 Tax=Acidiphilium iwatense TaxID=768198 RepID=A0ABS9DXZ8_9PROT|nr:MULTISPECIES: type VI secretion system protein TssA [Acidiphilium]MCF3947618.1 type VI secretion system protein TssA [Acidiphilium iwatense]MCU4160784.1 type VI secretion system protein TssA [Acidiphilium sp. AL]
MALDLTVLLEPIEGDAPCGADLRADYAPQSLYYRLRDARSDARAAERAADADPSLEPDAAQHWRTVLQVSQSVLGKTRDLEVAAWLTEALLREEGLGGLAQGARLIEGLARGFWDGLHPLPDEDGMETRLAPVAGLNGVGGDGTLMQPLRKLPLFAMPDGTPVALFQFQQAEETAGLGDEKRKAARIAAGVPEFAKLEVAARAAGAAHFAGLARAAQDAATAWRAMAAALDEVAGADSPPTGRVSELLDQIAAIARRYAPAVVPEAAAPTEAEAETMAMPDQAGGVPQARGPVRSREDALRQLSEIAEFFRRTEPQSPIPLTIDEAVRRARLSWPELIEDILADPATRQAMLTALGIKPGQ